MLVSLVVVDSSVGMWCCNVLIIERWKVFCTYKFHNFWVNVKGCNNNHRIKMFWIYLQFTKRILALKVGVEGWLVVAYVVNRTILRCYEVIVQSWKIRTIN